MLHPVTDTTDDTAGHWLTEEDFWRATPALSTIRDFAYARYASPWAVLGVTLARVACTIPPHAQLPPTIMSPASLNYFVALVAGSGGGKGGAVGVSKEAVNVGEDVDVETPGSGEGIPACYARHTKDGVDRYRDSVLFDMPEVDTLTALLGRSGATLNGVLRSMWMGERLGFGYRDPSKKLPVEEHTYRAAMILGVQPERAGSLLDDADGGTPQRFIWLPATDTGIGVDVPPLPAPLRLHPQSWPTDPLAIPDAAAEVIIAEHIARQREDREALDGHAILARLKTAQLLTVLDGRGRMTVDDWHRAGVVMRVSDRTRDRVRRACQAKAERAQKARGRMDHLRTAASDAAAAEVAVDRISRIIRSHLTRDGELAMSALRRRVHKRDRDYFDDALHRLESAGDVVVTRTGRGERVRGVWS